MYPGKFLFLVIQSVSLRVSVSCDTECIFESFCFFGLISLNPAVDCITFCHHGDVSDCIYDYININ